MNYTYSALVTKVYDGDTITADVRLGFGVVLEDQKIRLFGIDAPEIKGEERANGIVSRDRLRELILNKYVTLTTLADSKGKYGRYLGIIYYNGENINIQLVKERLAVNRTY